MKRSYLVYKIINSIDDYIYIGTHVTKNINDKYMGSGKLLKEAQKIHGIENFEKIILYNYDNKEDMLIKEQELVNREFIKNSKTYNLAIGGQGFSMIGRVTVKDKNGNTFSVDKNDLRYLSGELLYIQKGCVNVKDKNGNCFRVSVNDPRYISGELVHTFKGNIVVKDKEGNYFRIPVNDPRFLNGELVHVTKGTVTVKDKNGNYFRVPKNDPRFLSRELVGHTFNRKLTSIHKRKIGKANSILQLGEGNSQYGKCWIYSLKEKKSITIKKEELKKYIDEGWIKGRKIKNW